MSNYTDGACEFCVKQLASSSDRGDFEILWSDPNILLVAALGALSEGHTLIMPRRHALAMSELTSEEARSAALAAEVAWKLLRYAEGERVLFENATSLQSSGAPRGGCIDHAHWNIVATNATNPLNDGARLYRWEYPNFSAMISSARLFSQPYRLWASDNGAWIERSKFVSSKDFRRHLTVAANRPDEWDYLVYPMLERVQRTKDLFERFGRDYESR